MQATKEISRETAQAFQVLCEFCAQLLGENPSEEFFSGLIENRALLLQEPFSTCAPTAAKELHDQLEAAISEESPASAIAEAKQDYTYLFYMVGASGTSPYESVYRTDDRTMFGPTTLEVRAAYKAYGREVPSQGSVPDDHIAYELSFMAQLFARAQGEAESGDTAAARKTLSDAAEFLAGHLLVFAPVYCANLRTRAQEPWYRCIAGITASTIQAMADAWDVEAEEQIDENAYLLI